MVFMPVKNTHFNMGSDDLQADGMHYTQLRADEAGLEKAHLGFTGQNADLLKQESEVLELTRTGWRDTLITHTHEGKVRPLQQPNKGHMTWGEVACLYAQPCK